MSGHHLNNKAALRTTRLVSLSADTLFSWTFKQPLDWILAIKGLLCERPRVASNSKQLQLMKSKPGTSFLYR